MSEPRTPDEEPIEEVFLEETVVEPPTPPQQGYGTPPPPASAYPSADSAGFPPPPGAYPPPGASAYPPPGAYAPPPADAFPPPPPTSFPPPPPAYGGYGAPPPATDPADIGTALGWAWKKTTANLWPLILAHVLWGLAIGLVVMIMSAVLVFPSLAVTESSDGAVAAVGALSAGATIVFVGVILVVAFLSQIGLINGYLTIADGKKAQIGDFFKFRNVGQAALIAIIVGLAGGLLSFTYIGTYVVSFFTIYALYFAIDRNAGFTEALRLSAQLALKYVVPTILIVLVVSFLGGIGAIACGIGLLITIPWTQLALTYTFRRLTGGYVAPAA